LGKNKKHIKETNLKSSIRVDRKMAGQMAVLSAVSFTAYRIVTLS
jgi:ribosomal protein L20